MRTSSVVLFLLAAAISAPAQDTGRATFREAEGHFLARSYSRAIERYEDFLRARPDSPYAADARYRRAVALYRLCHADEAYAAFQAVEARYRSTRYLPYVPFRMAVIDFERSSFDAAAARFEALTASPPDADTLRQSLLYLGKCRSAQGRPSDAIAAFERLLAEVPVPEAEGEALVLLADLAVSTKNHDKAVALWERIDASKIEAATADRVALRAAEAYAALGQTEVAAPLFDRLASSPRREVATAALARLLAQSRRDGDERRNAAIAIRAENALRSRPEALAEFWFGLGAEAFHEGRLDLARSYFQRIEALIGTEKLPSDASIYLAEIAAREGDTAGAYAILAAAAPFSREGEALLKTRMGRYALDLGRWEDARIVLTEAIAAGPATATAAAAETADLARSYLAYALYRSDQVEEALGALGPAPAHAAGVSGVQAAWAARLRAELLRKTGKGAESLAALEAAVAAKPSDAETRLALLALFFEYGQFARVLAASAELPLSTLAPKLHPAASYMTGVAAAATGDYASAFSRLDAALGGSPVASASAAASLADAAPWAAYWRSWTLYRLSRFGEAKASFDAFVAAYPGHASAYSAAYLSAWSAANGRDYRAAATAARKAADLATAAPASASSGGVASAEVAERIAAARYLEGTIRPFFSDWDGAIAALDAVAPSTSYTVKAALERGAVLDAAGRTDAADAAYAAVSRTWPTDPLAPEAAYRRGELLYRAKRWADAADRFAAYRTSYPSGQRIDGALYLGGVSLSQTGKGDAAILLWERLLKDHPVSRYRFPALLAAGRAYREKHDWEAAFRVYTAAVAEFGDRARSAGAEEEAEVLRYLIAKLPEKAARLHVRLGVERGAATAAGRRTALELARFYIEESTQREAGLPLLDEVIALRAEDPAAAAEAELLTGDYYARLENWDRAATAYLAAASTAAEAPASAQLTRGGGVRAEGAPEALYKAASARLRSGKKASAAEVVATLAKTFPASSWTTRAKRLLETDR